MKTTSLLVPSVVLAGLLLAANVSYAQNREGMSPQRMMPGWQMGPGQMMKPGWRTGGGHMMGMMGMMGGNCPMTGMMMDDEKSPTFSAGRIAFLKAELAISDDQKEVWDAYADALKTNLQSMQGMWEMMTTVMEAGSPVKRLDAHISAMESRLTALKEIKPALAKLYAALSDKQKEKANVLLTGMGCMM